MRGTTLSLRAVNANALLFHLCTWQPQAIAFVVLCGWRGPWRHATNADEERPQGHTRHTTDTRVHSRWHLAHLNPLPPWIPGGQRSEHASCGCGSGASDVCSNANQSLAKIQGE